jgi:protein tyrosine phosphatase (PTP) superfamily phosphohydrolase (DUF442 family)
VLARGEQPALEPATFEGLRTLGITSVLSLRPDREGPSANASRPWPEYHVQDERALVEGAGLRFHHFPLDDFSAPSPEQISAVLTMLDEAVAVAPGVYVHCRAGAGRTGLVTSAWRVARGGSGDEAVQTYVRFMLQIAETLGYTEEERLAFLRRVGQPYVYWALCQIVSALGSPVTHDPPELLPAERPPEADHWEDRYANLLRPWRR